jgi:pilus assembly protein CpaB
MRPVEDTTQIVVAALPVSLGAKLTEADVRMAAHPKASLPEGAFTSIAQVVGRGVLASLVGNEPILAKDLAAEGSGAGLMSTIPDGMRAVSVRVNDVVGVAGFVVPGSRVDVILSGSPTSLGNVEMSKVILENIQVLSAGQNIGNDDQGRPLNVQVVTLLVTPEQSEALALASDGKIHLSLRNPLDQQEVKPTVVRREDLFRGIGSAPTPPAAAPRPAAPRVRQTKAPVAPPPPVIAPPPPQAPVATPAKPRIVPVQVIQGNQIKEYTFEGKPDSGEASDK